MVAVVVVVVFGSEQSQVTFPGREPTSPTHHPHTRLSFRMKRAVSPSVHQRVVRQVPLEPSEHSERAHTQAGHTHPSIVCLSAYNSRHEVLLLILRLPIINSAQTAWASTFITHEQYHPPPQKTYKQNRVKPLYISLRT